MKIEAKPVRIGGSSLIGFLSAGLYLLASKLKFVTTFASNSDFTFTSFYLGVSFFIFDCSATHLQIVVLSPFSPTISEQTLSSPLSHSSCLHSQTSYSIPSSFTTISHTFSSSEHSSFGQRQSCTSSPLSLCLVSHIFTFYSQPSSGHRHISFSLPSLTKQISCSLEHSGFSGSGHLHTSYSAPSIDSTLQIFSLSSHSLQEHSSVVMPSMTTSMHSCSEIGHWRPLSVASHWQDSCCYPSISVTMQTSSVPSSQLGRSSSH